MSDVIYFVAAVNPVGGGDDFEWTGPSEEVEILSFVLVNNNDDNVSYTVSIGPGPGGSASDAYLDYIQHIVPARSAVQICFPHVLPANSSITAFCGPGLPAILGALEYRPYPPVGTAFPTVYAASVNVAGDELLVSLTKPVLGDAGFSLSATGGAVTLTPATPGVANRRYDLSRIIAGDETVTLDYAPGDIEDYAGRDLAAFSGLAVTNNSTAGGVLLSDTFTDTNGTNLTAHAMDVGGGWTAGLGTITVQSNAASQSASATAYVADAGQADYTLTVDLITAGSGSTALGGVVRYTDSANYWIVEIDSTVPAIRLYQKTGGSYTTRASASPTINNATTYALEITCSGDTISATLDGGSNISYGSASQGNTSTLCGIGNTWTVNQSWDNFEVQG